jgi:hypothetical protein
MADTWPTDGRQIPGNKKAACFKAAAFGGALPGFKGGYCISRLAAS